MATSKVILIDNNTSKVYVLNSKGVLSDYLSISLNTINNWFAGGIRKVNRYDYTIMLVDKVIKKSYPNRPDRKKAF